MRRRRGLRAWLVAVGIAVLVATVWILAVTVLPGGGGPRHGRVTAMGLMTVLAFIVIALIVEKRDVEKSNAERVARRRKRRDASR